MLGGRSVNLEFDGRSSLAFDRHGLFDLPSERESPLRKRPVRLPFRSASRRHRQPRRVDHQSDAAELAGRFHTPAEEAEMEPARRLYAQTTHELAVFASTFATQSNLSHIIVQQRERLVFLVAGSWRRKALAGLVVLACGGAVLLASPHVRSRVADGMHEIATADQAERGTRFGSRVVYWRNAARMIADHPLLGVGTGGFQAAYATYVRGVEGWQGHETGDPHNQYIKFQAEQGILGLAAFLFFIYWTFRGPAPQPWRALAAAALIGWCAISIASSEFSTHNQGRLIFFWLGAMLGGEMLVRRPETIQREREV